MPIIFTPRPSDHSRSLRGICHYSESEWALIVHELGHQVVTLALGGGVGYTTVENWSSEGGFSENSPLPRWDGEDSAVEYLAGGVAARMLGLHSPASQADLDNANSYVDKHGLSISQCEAKAERLLSIPANRSTIEAAAGEIARCKRMEGSRLVEIAIGCGMRVEPEIPRNTHRYEGMTYLDQPLAKKTKRGSAVQSDSDLPVQKDVAANANSDDSDFFLVVLVITVIILLFAAVVFGGIGGLP